MIVIPFKNTLVNLTLETGYVETLFPEDDTKCPSIPQYNTPEIKTAEELGYGTRMEDVKRMTIEHEILHTFLCESCGLPYSPTLWSVAHNQDRSVEGVIDIWRQYEEEALILSFQKYLNTKMVEPPLEHYQEVTKLKLRDLKYDALKVLDL